MDVFEAFPDGITPYTFLEISRGGIHGKTIINTVDAEGIFKLRRGYSTSGNESNSTDDPRMHIRPYESFIVDGNYKKLVGHGIRHDGIDYGIKDITGGDNYEDGVREHYTLILESADYSEFES